jgi:DNA-binding NarL/FixJ family response regulator
MATTIKTLVAVDRDVRREEVLAALPSSAGDIEITGIVDGLDDAWRLMQETANDLIVVGCAGHSERVLLFIENAIRDQPNRPVVVLCQGSPNGFVQRAFDAGADDLLRLPETSDALYFALQKAVARKHGGSVGGGTGQAPDRRGARGRRSSLPTSA